MTNALVNRIRQRIEARRDFMRTVFANHHVLVWRMTDAPNLQALGMKPKKVEPNRSRAVQVPREANLKPRVVRAFEIPELDSEIVENAPTIVEETQILNEINAKIPSLETSSDLEPSEQGDSEIVLPELSAKFEPQHAPEILERHESSATPERQPGVVPSIRSGETTPPDVSPRASEKSVAKRAEELETPLVQPFEHEQIADQAAVMPEETRVLEPELPVAVEAAEIRNEDMIQNTNSLTIEQTPNLIEPKTTQNQNVPATPTKSITAARAQEVLQKADELDSTIAISSTDQTQKTESRLRDQVRIPDSSEPALEAISRLESDIIESKSENRLESGIEPQLKPEVVTRDALEVLKVRSEHQASSEVQTSSVEAESSILTTEVEAQNQPAEETRALETQTVIELTPQEQQFAATPEVLQPQAREALQTPRESQQESVAQESQQESVAQESQQESVAQESQQESAAQATQYKSMPQESIPREAPTESQGISEPQQSPLPTPEQSDWQRSIPGDPQSGVVEIIRARPPRNLHPDQIQKPSDVREQALTKDVEIPEARVTKSPEDQTRQTLSERMKALQNRFGEKEQSRFDPNTSLFAQSNQVEASDVNAPVPGFKSIADIAQRLAQRYSNAQQPSQKAPDLPPDPKIGQTFNATQIRAASAFVQQGTQPIQLRESTLVFLEPLIGFDPREAKVFVSPQATEFTTSLNADGATVGTDVYLNNGFDEQSPTGLGLLAHELTHVGQNLQPDFVPPMLQSTLGQQDLTNESGETQARILEARVNQTASLFVPGMSLEATNARQTSTAPTVSNNAARNTDAWNGLPAPWEAMPSLNSNTTDFVSVVSPNAPDSSATTNTGVASVSEAPSALVQLADSDRPSENRDNVQPGAAGGQPAHSPAQDMDVLAQQVYEILKRRLSSERRREG
jgi:Domain of unknown function (DUF4157)